MPSFSGISETVMFSSTAMPDRPPLMVLEWPMVALGPGSRPSLSPGTPKGLVGLCEDDSPRPSALFPSKYPQPPGFEDTGTLAD